MQMLEQQISGPSQSKVLGVVLRYHPQLRMEGGIVGDTQCKAIQFVLLAVVVKVGKMDTDLLLTHNGYMLGGGNIETAVIAVTFRGAYLAAAGRSERVGQSPARQPACISRTAPPSTHADGRKSSGPGS